MDHGLAHFTQLVAKVVRDARVLAAEHFTVQTSHVVCPEGRPQRNRFVEDAAERPDVTFHVVRLVAPDLGTRIVRCARLSVEQPSLGHFRYIHVTQFCGSVLVQKQISAFEIAMENVCVVEGLKAFDHLNENAPDVLLSQVSLLFLVPGNFLK